MGAERLKSLKRGVLAMRKMLREMEIELERELAEVARGKRQVASETDVQGISERVIGRLNTMMNRSFKPDSITTLHLIRSRIEEGWTEEDLIAVVDEMCYRWGGDKERELWLRPETLFGQHFESYLQEARVRNGAITEHKDLARMAIERIQGGN